jgi:tetratricopeptide (TPR) repeat protein
MRKVRESDPDNLTALSILAKLSIETTDRFLAKKYYQRLIDLEPLVVEPYLVLGKMAFQDNDFVQAKDLFSRAIEIDSGNYSVWYHLGLISDITGNTRDAVAGFEKCIELNPEFLPAYYENAMLLMERGDYQKAVDLLKHYSFSRKSYPVLLALGDCYLGLNQPGKAIDAWQSAIDTLTINTDTDREKAAIAYERLARWERVD